MFLDLMKFGVFFFPLLAPPPPGTPATGGAGISVISLGPATGPIIPRK